MTSPGPIYLDPDFRSLLLEVSATRSGKISPAFIEKDYWVTRTLRILEECGLEIWFKGGTGLSKGFGAVQRFSEDLDLKLLGSQRCPLPHVVSWTSQGQEATKARRDFFVALRNILKKAQLNCNFSADQDPTMRAAAIECPYPGVYKDLLSPPFRPFVLLEIGNARVTPYLPRTISSFVHDFLEQAGLLGSYNDERPTVRCVHPLVTLIEKLDAIVRHYSREVSAFYPEKFVRHYDDAAAVIAYLEGAPGRNLPKPHGLTSVRALAEEMLASKDIRRIPYAEDDPFNLQDAKKRTALESAHAAIGPMYWGDRISLKAACARIRTWISRELA